MTLEEKARMYTEIFNKYFVYKGEHNENGSYIPLASVNFDYGSGYVGDGTINIAHYLTYLYLKGDNERIWRIKKTLRRLSDNAYSLYKERFNHENIPYRKEPGFFMRDDISDSISHKFNLRTINSGYSSCIENPENEDLCYSLFTSQDQIWNLAPILSKVDSDLLYEMLKYVIDNKHVIYNPYESAILHYWTFLPSTNEKKVKPWERIQNMKDNLKYKVKVKRGARNWYFAYGFRKTFKKIGGKCGTFWSAIWYKPFIFLADRVYHPYICKWFNLKVKNNSYYCMGLAGNAWYGGNVHKRLVKLFNKSLDTDELFLPNIVTLSDYAHHIDMKKLKGWLERYPEPAGFEYGSLDSPIIFMILYEFYKKNTDNE